MLTVESSSLKLKKNNIFDEKSFFSNDIRIFNGSNSGMINTASNKYYWSSKLYDLMLSNFWIPEKFSTLEDSAQYLSLLPAEKHVYDDLISSLTWLDSIQTRNLPNISNYITAPEVKILYEIQTFQEALHVKTYNNLTQSIVKPIDYNAFFRTWESNSKLKERNDFFHKIYQNFIDDGSIENLTDVLLASYALEGISFTIGFRYFYDIAYSLNYMHNTADSIKLIHRDEDSHCLLAKFTITEHCKESNIKLDLNRVSLILEKAALLEIEYINTLHSCNDMSSTRLSINPASAEACVKYVANKRGNDIGVGNLFPGFDEDPLSYLAQVSGQDENIPIRENYFEGHVSQYKMSTVLEDDL